MLFHKGTPSENFRQSYADPPRICRGASHLPAQSGMMTRVPTAAGWCRHSKICTCHSFKAKKKLIFPRRGQYLGLAWLLLKDHYEIGHLPGAGLTEKPGAGLT